MAARALCHSCNNAFRVADPDRIGDCPRCGQGFVELLEDRAADPAGGQGWSYELPGGLGAVRVGVSVAGGARAAGAPLAHDEYVQQMLASLAETGLGGLLGAAGAGLGGGAAPGESEREWLDRVVTGLMDQFQPETRATAERVRAALPRVEVRAADAAGEPGDGEACIRAGDNCAVCQDVYAAREAVIELPCSHCFHGSCIMPWLEEHNTCPTCRLELPSQPRAEGRGAAAAAARDAAGPSRPAAAQPTGFVGMMDSLATMWGLRAHAPDAEDEAEEEARAAAAEARRRHARQAERARYSEVRRRSGSGQRRGMDGRPPPEPVPAPAPEPVRATAPAAAANNAFAGAVAGGALGVIAGVVVAILLRRQV